MDRFLFLSKGDETKLKVFHSLDQPLVDLTVETICRKSGISKPTFYRHFASKIDIPVWAAQFMNRLTLDQIGRTLTWREGMEAYFALGIQELPYLRNLTVDPISYIEVCSRRSVTRYDTIAETLAMHGIEVDDALRSTIEGYLKVELHFSEERLDATRSTDAAEVFSIVRPFIPERLFQALDTPLTSR